MTVIEPGFAYTAAQREQYEREGYLLFPTFLSPEGLDACRRECDALISRLHPNRPPEMIISAHVQERWLFDLACEPRLLDIIEAHIGPNLLLWGSHLVCKPPGGGRSIPWHQDETYFNIKGRYPPTIWIALRRQAASLPPCPHAQSSRPSSMPSSAKRVLAGTCAGGM